MALNHLKTVCSLALALLLFALSLSSFEYLKFKTTNNNNDLSIWNFYSSSRNTHAQELNNKIKEIEDILDFMVWPVEHQKIRKEYLSLLKQKIILNPNQNRTWQLLLAELHQQNLYAQEVNWSLRNAIEFNKWNIKSRFWLAFYCIELNNQLDKQLRSNCQKLIKSLPLSINRNRLAQMIGIDREKLDITIERLDLTNVVND